MLAILFAAYQPVWRAGFIWDDDDHVTANACVVGPLGFKEIWTTSAARICPLVLSSFRVQHALWGLKPLPYHLVTLLMHGLAAVVLWRVLLRLQVPGAWFGAALWALHPVQVESAAWITELKNTQSGLFYMLTLLFFARARLAEAAAGERVRRRNDWIAVGFGVLALAGGVLWSALGKVAGGSPFIRPAACGLVLAGLGFLTWRHAAVFKDDESLWRDTLAKNPACWMAHNNWGYDLADLGQAEEAKAHYLAALQAYPNFPEAHFNLAAVLLGEGNTEAATQHYLAAISAKPGFAEAHSDLSNLLVKQGDTRGAIQHAAEAIRLRPNYPQAHFNLGNALNSQGQLTNAVVEYAAAVRLRPNYAEARYNLGCALYLLGRADEAVAQLSEVILLQPANAAAGCKLAFILAARGRGREAINLYREVLRQQPEFGAAWRGLAWLLATDPHAELRDGPEAVRLATRAAELAGPPNARALDTLAAAYAQVGRFAEAAATSRQAQALAAAQGQESYAEEIGRRLALYGDNLAYRGGAMSP